MADDVRRLANVEGLTAHAASIDVRLAERDDPAPRTPARRARSRTQEQSGERGA